MFIPKIYGQGRIERCPFCAKTATAKNSQNVPVCPEHREETLDDLKCLCGEYLDILEGKYGVFFKCIKCGNMNLRKVAEFNTIKAKQKVQPSGKPYLEKRTSEKKEITVRSDDPRYFS